MNKYKQHYFTKQHAILTYLSISAMKRQLSKNRLNKCNIIHIIIISINLNSTSNSFALMFILYLYFDNYYDHASILTISDFL